MAYLVTFHWGWLLASLLLGLAMGWIAVVHRGQGVSKRMSRVLAVLGAALVAAGRAAVGPGGARARDPRAIRLLAGAWPEHVCPVSGRMRGGVVAARLGGGAAYADD